MKITSPGPLHKLALSDDGDTVAAQYSGCVYAFRAGKELAPFSGSKYHGPIALSADGSSLFGGDNTVSVVDTDTRTKAWAQKTKNGVDAAAFSPDGKFVAYRELAGNLCLRNAATGDLAAAVSIKTAREGYFGSIVASGFSKSGAVLGTVVERGRNVDLVRWRVPTLEPLDVTPIQYGVLSERAGAAVVFGEGGHTLIDLDDPTTRHGFTGVAGVMDPFTAIRIDITGRYVSFLEELPMDPFRACSVWDAFENREVARVDKPEQGVVVLLGPGAKSAVCVVGKDRKVAAMTTLDRRAR